jgi:hypothetical protein
MIFSGFSDDPGSVLAFVHRLAFMRVKLRLESCCCILYGEAFATGNSELLIAIRANGAIWRWADELYDPHLSFCHAPMISWAFKYVSS